MSKYKFKSDNKEKVELAINNTSRKIRVEKDSDRKASCRVPIKVLGAILAFVVIIGIVIGVIIHSHRFDIRDYIKVSYVGANGYATPQFTIDKENLKTRLIGDSKDSQKLLAINNLVNSMEVSSNSTDVSNGDKIKVNISYDSSYMDIAKVKLNLTKYDLRVSGVSSGKKISLFDTIEVTFNGISPEASVTITNKNEDEYLKGLTFSADKTKNIAFGDTITVRCDTSSDDIKRHGYIIDSDYATYTADKLGKYINGAGDINKDVFNQIKKEASDAITSETNNTTFRMLYKATKNKDSLKQTNEETVTDIQLMSKYLLYNGTNGSDYNNVIILIYSTTVSNKEKSETVYFAFSYYNNYLTPDGNFEMTRGMSNENYEVSTDSNALINSLVNSQNSRYTITELKDF